MIIDACRDAFPVVLENEHTSLFVGTGKAEVTPYLTHYTIEYATDTSRTIASLLFSGAAARFPDIRWIHSHGGGTMPYLAGRFLGGKGFAGQRGLVDEEILRRDNPAITWNQIPGNAAGSTAAIAAERAKTEAMVKQDPTCQPMDAWIAQMKKKMSAQTIMSEIPMTSFSSPNRATSSAHPRPWPCCRTW